MVQDCYDHPVEARAIDSHGPYLWSMTIAQVLCSWTGLQGGTGYSIFYARSTAASSGPLNTFWAAVKAQLPNAVTVNVPNSGKLIDEATGKMTGVWGAGSTSANTGTGGTNYPPSAGCQIKWLTTGFNRGRKVSGRTYLVPLPTTAFTSTGTIATTVTGALFTPATQLISDWTGNMVVWSRPVMVLGADGKPTDEIKYPGTIYTITSALTPTKSVSQTGRRDA
jgi:hypothetical protein